MKVKDKDYEYRYIEQSVDVRTWRINSPKKLTEKEIQDLAVDSGFDREGEMSEDKKTKIIVEYEGVEYGDDCQTEIQGDTANEQGKIMQDKTTDKAIDKLNQVITDYVNIFDTEKKEIEEIEQSLEILIQKNKEIK